MELFDLLNCIFKDPIEYAKVSKLDKKRNFFMIQRRLAIGHPLQAHVLNNLKINPDQAVDIWQRFIIKQYNGKMPGWMFIKGAKKNKEIEEKKVNITFKDLAEFAKYNKYDIKSVKDAIKLFPTEIKKEIDQFITNNEKPC
jgi:hypothetical protein